MVYCREIEELDIQQGNEDATNYSISRLLTDKGGVSTMTKDCSVVEKRVRQSKRRNEEKSS